MKHRIVTQRKASKGYLQNRRMGKACKKDWDTGITYIRNVFVFIAVWINPLRIEAKIGIFAHPNLCQWIYFIWDTMIPRALQDFIKTDQIRRKLEWDIKENATLNLIQDFLSDGHLVNFQLQVPVEVPQYAPYSPGAMVESKKIDLDPLSEKHRMAILKKRQSFEEKKELKRRLEELNKKKET